MEFAEKFILVVLFLPIIGILLYTIFYPEESALWGKRWQFKNESLEPSDEVIKFNRTSGIIVLILILIILIVSLFR